MLFPEFSVSVLFGCPLLTSCSSEMKAADKFASVVKHIRDQHQTAPKNKKRQWASLLAHDLTLKEMQDHGFQITSHAFTNARKHARLNGSGAEVVTPPNPTGYLREKVTEEDRAHILTTIQDPTISRQSPNKTVKISKPETAEQRRARRKTGQKKTKDLVQVHYWQVSAVARAYSVYKARTQKEGWRCGYLRNYFRVGWSLIPLQVCL
jgi:hypothetical protein